MVKKILLSVGCCVLAGMNVCSAVADFETAADWGINIETDRNVLRQVDSLLDTNMHKELVDVSADMIDTKLYKEKQIAAYLQSAKEALSAKDWTIMAADKPMEQFTGTG